MNPKVVSDFFGLTTPDEKPQDEETNTVNDSLSLLNTVGEETKQQDVEMEDLVNSSNNDSDTNTDIESESEDEEDLQKLEGYTEKNILIDYHPEVVQISEEELLTLSIVVKDKNGKIVDPLHKTIPIMTRYEKAKIIGIRAQQINSGSQPFVQVDPNMIDGLTIANEELIKQKIPFIIRRPMSNGASEYWNLKDLEILE
jgi:DNA-directed RNA polymerases I, II, and III subunit RPABC2